MNFIEKLCVRAMVVLTTGGLHYQLKKSTCIVVNTIFPPPIEIPTIYYLLQL